MKAERSFYNKEIKENEKMTMCQKYLTLIRSVVTVMSLALTVALLYTFVHLYNQMDKEGHY